MALQGGCACGKVRYRLKSAPMIVHCCHCKDCQRQTGTAFVINALIETDRLDVEGETAPDRMPTDSGGVHDIYRCVSCGTALWSDYGGRPWMRFVRVGTLDEPAEAPPDVHIFTRSKLPWVGLPPDAKTYEVFYGDWAEVWPPEAMARRKAASGASR